MTAAAINLTQEQYNAYIVLMQCSETERCAIAANLLPSNFLVVNKQTALNAVEEIMGDFKSYQNHEKKTDEKINEVIASVNALAERL